jgi:outer membrane cobalamin receptor
VGDTLPLDEVTVTAIKQSADLRTEATALTVIGRQEAERNQVLSVKAAADLVPNLFIPDYGSRMTSTPTRFAIGMASATRCGPFGSDFR